MANTKLKLMVCAATALAVGSCASDDLATGGEGRVVIGVALNSDVAVSRAQSDMEELAREARIDICSPRGLVRRFNGLDSLPADGVALLSGPYTARATAGDSVPASWQSRYFTGKTAFEVTHGATSRVDIACTIANVAASVNTEAVPEFVSVTATVGTPSGRLTWENGDARRGYFMLPASGQPLEWELTATGADGTTTTKTGAITDPRRATEYVLTVKYGGPAAGSADFTVTVDEQALEIRDQVVIAMPPEITGLDFDIEQPVAANAGAVGVKAIMVSASSALTAATISCAGLGTVDLMSKLETAGVDKYYEYDPSLDVAHLLVAVNDDITNALPQGTHLFTITATDANGYTSKATMTLVVSADPVVTEPAAWQDVWATHATLRATVVDTSLGAYGFRYRKAGEASWEDAPAALDGAMISAQIQGLLPGTRYEYAAVAGEFQGKTLEFTTEAATQLPNAGFEDWQTDKTPFLLYAAGGEMFWDSGNHGSATLRKNVTTPDDAVKHSGSRAACLRSQFVGVGALGKFAAGNLFAGKYLATVGTDGVLGWGRPFGSRPRALRGYVKYRPQPIEYANADCPYAELAKGAMDQATIYVALLTDHAEAYGGDSFPVIVKTKPAERQLFSRDASNVAAYGEAVWKQATPGEDMVEFEIPLEYKPGHARVANIMVVAAASRGGDYFVGGPSTLWVDDLELVY